MNDRPLQLDYASADAMRFRPAVLELLALAGPTIAQMASYTVMMFIDRYLLSRLGALEATAAGNAGGIAFSVITFGLGVLLVVNTLTSQAYGGGRHTECGKYLWQGLWFAAIYWLIMLPMIPLMPGMFRYFGHEPDMIAHEAVYARIMLFGAFFKLAGVTLGQFLIAVNHPRVVLMSSVCGVLCNVAVAWTLILGKMGFPKVGVAGAAWAQNVGVAVETFVLVGFIALTSIRARFNAMDWRPRWREMQTLIRVGVPSGLQTVAEVLAWVLFCNWVMSAYGSAAMAANTFMLGYMAVGFMPTYGISTAVTALVGRYIGMKRPDIARHRTHIGFLVAGLYVAVCGVFFFVLRRPMMRLFTDDPEILRIGAILLTFAALYQVFDAMFIIYNGGLRGAGDTFIPGVVVGALVWSANVGGGLLVAKHFLSFGPIGPWIVTLTYGIIAGFYLWGRFIRGKWELIHLEKDEPGDRVRAMQQVT